MYTGRPYGTLPRPETATAIPAGRRNVPGLARRRDRAAWRLGPARTRHRGTHRLGCSPRPGRGRRAPLPQPDAAGHGVTTGRRDCGVARPSAPSAVARGPGAFLPARSTGSPDARILLSNWVSVRGVPNIARAGRRRRSSWREVSQLSAGAGTYLCCRRPMSRARASRSRGRCADTAARQSCSSRQAGQVVRWALTRAASSGARALSAYPASSSRMVRHSWGEVNMMVPLRAGRVRAVGAATGFRRGRHPGIAR